MSGFWAVFWLAVVLKVPIAALLWIIWWAVREPPQHGAGGEGDGGSPHDHPHPRLRPPGPRRRGPHGLPGPASPERVRVLGGDRRVPAGHR